MSQRTHFNATEWWNVPLSIVLCCAFAVECDNSHFCCLLCRIPLPHLFTSPGKYKSCVVAQPFPSFGQARSHYTRTYFMRKCLLIYRRLEDLSQNRLIWFQFLFLCCARAKWQRKCFCWKWATRPRQGWNIAKINEYLIKYVHTEYP